MKLRSVVGMVAVVFGVTASACATSATAVSSEAAATGAAEAVTTADAKPGDAGSSRAKVEKEGSDTPVIESGCLKEGEPCNVITNRCCPGYSCQGGLTAVCAPEK